ncbi:Xaa-Pro peptidase family protein [Bradyrhizobium sp. SRL28]|uniref:M24 family metallopeptidase n=1 Tax=Bradyrhizobium sp. SRL28 TaxID=2836178 RepID=UPI001BDF5BB8|nr:Xaa-Pro peptidase family protein [Bradyrhizobium sp. SRL28]MBT1516781.1 Xaa-Pro peptidase family protein [Bradyrhizobium sp. SRL28]
MTGRADLLPLDAIDQLPFTPAEYNARLAACRKAMREREIDYLVLNSPENIYYLSGFITRGYYVFQALVVTHSSEPTLVVRRYEQVNVERLSYYRNAAIWQDTDVPAEVLARRLFDLGAAGKTVGVDANSVFFPVSAYETLRAMLPGAKFINGSSVMEGRAVKSPQEIAYIRRAAEARNAGFKAAHEATRPGRTENDVAAAFHYAAISAGSEYMAGPPYIVSGPRTALPHGTWAGRRIEKGDLVQVEGSGNWRRYSASLMRTWSMGKPSDSVRRAADASKSALDSAIAAIKPGATSGDVDAACRGAVARAGLAHAFVHRTGYSVGVGICPGWGEGAIMDLKDGDSRVLRPGMVFHIVPVLFPEPDVSVGVSALVLVTQTGAEIISDYSRDLQCE